MHGDWKLKVVQIISLLLLTVGVMLINIDNIGTTAEDAKNVAMKGIIATLGKFEFGGVRQNSFLPIR